MMKDISEGRNTENILEAETLIKGIKVCKTCKRKYIKICDFHKKRYGDFKTELCGLINTKHHFLKFQTYEGIWFTYYNPSKSKIERIINKLNPKNCYISINTFLRYKEHKPKLNMILKKYGLIDIDGQNFKNKKEVIKYFIKICKYLNKNNIKIIESVCTNEKYGGYQIVIENESKILEIMKKFKKIDRSVFNEKGVRRLAGTYNGNKSSFSYHCDEKAKSLNTCGCKNIVSPLFPLRRTQNLFPLGGDEIAGVNAPVMPIKADDKGQNTDSDHQIKAKNAIRGTHLRHYIQVNNSVKGAKGLYVPVLYEKRINKEVLKNIVKLQKIYKLGDLYIMNNRGGFVFFGLKCIDGRRLLKLLKKHGKKYNFFIKYKVLWAYIGNIIGCLKQKSKGVYSRPHNNFFKLNYNNLVGSEKLPVFDVIIETTESE